MRVDKPIDIKPGELRCPHCFNRDIVPSMPRGIWDEIMRRFDRIPRHCRSCGRRFHPKVQDVKRSAALRAEEEQLRNQQAATGTKQAGLKK